MRSAGQTGGKSLQYLPTKRSEHRYGRDRHRRQHTLGKYPPLPATLPTPLPAHLPARHVMYSLSPPLSVRMLFSPVCGALGGWDNSRTKATCTVGIPTVRGLSAGFGSTGWLEKLGHSSDGIRGRSDEAQSFRLPCD
jgi:hypothetical protein